MNRLPLMFLCMAVSGLIGFAVERWLGLAGAAGMVTGGLCWFAFETRRHSKIEHEHLIHLREHVARLEKLLGQGEP